MKGLMLSVGNDAVIVNHLVWSLARDMFVAATKRRVLSALMVGALFNWASAEEAQP